MGDLIDVGGVFGKVNKMSLVSASLLTLDSQTIVVPNSKIWGDVIKNLTD
jgi:small conductance mechanosensitive channel